MKDGEDVPKDQQDPKLNVRGLSDNVNISETGGIFGNGTFYRSPNMILGSFNELFDAGVDTYP